MHFQHLWAFAATMAVLSGLVTALLRRGRPVIPAVTTPTAAADERRDRVSPHDPGAAARAPTTGPPPSPPSDGGWTVDLDGSWSIGGFLNGGYLLVPMGMAAAEATARPDPLAVTATFLSPPTSGPAEITVALAKRGRQSSVADVALHQGGRTHVRATAVLGDLDRVRRARVSTPPRPPSPARGVRVHR